MVIFGCPAALIGGDQGKEGELYFNVLMNAETRNGTGDYRLSISTKQVINKGIFQIWVLISVTGQWNRWSGSLRRAIEREFHLSVSTKQVIDSQAGDQGNLNPNRCGRCSNF
jgi:hypothetical protein